MFTDLIDAKRILREIKLMRHLGRHDNVIEILDMMTTPPRTEVRAHTGPEERAATCGGGGSCGDCRMRRL